MTRSSWVGAHGGRARLEHFASDIRLESRGLQRTLTRRNSELLSEFIVAAFMTRRLSSGTILFALVVLTTLLVTSSPAATRAHRGGLRLHLKFTRVATNECCTLLASKQYMLLFRSSDPQRYQVFDDARGKRWGINTSGCANAMPPFDHARGMFGAPWMVFECSPNSDTPYLALYNVTDRTWRLLPALSPSSTAEIVVGSEWIEAADPGNQDCGDHIHFYCGQAIRFLNIRSGQWRAQPGLTSTTRIDLDSPRLVRSLCRPLRAPSNRLLAVYRGFALVFSARSGFINSTTAGTLRGWNAQQCGSGRWVRGTPPHARRLREFWGALTANNHAVLGAVLLDGMWTGEIGGRFLPSRHSFTGRIPGFSGQFLGSVVLDSSRLYVADGNSTVWAARFPSGP
jgi:hypothetical protein